MPGLAPELPLRRDDVDGYGLLKTFSALAQQNLKMVILTNPGERIMDPEFGVGILRYLFEQSLPTTYSQISSRIRSQVSAYLPYITILNIDFIKPTSLENNENLLSVNIEYLVTPLRLKNTLDITLDTELAEVILPDPFGAPATF